MKKMTLMDKYPIVSHEIKKDTTNLQTVDAVIAQLKSFIQEHPVAKYIAVFDHYEHTSNLGEDLIAKEILDAKNIIFCFGKQIPTTKILAVRPRTIGVCELKDSFMIDFMEAPNEQLQKTLEKWVGSL